MKKFSSLVLATLLLLAACNDKKPKEATTIGDDGKEKVTTDPNATQNAEEEMGKKKEELSKLTPLTSDQLKALLPATLLGTATKDANATEARGTMLATASYKMNDSAYMLLSIYDCGGSGGAGMYSMHFQDMLNPPQESGNEYSKTIDFNDAKAIEACNKLYRNCSLSYFAAGRYLVVIQETNLGVEALEQAADELKLK